MINDVAIMQNAVSNRLLDLFQQSITLVFLLGLLLSTHFRLALFALVAAPVLLVPIVRFGRGLRRTTHRSQERMADLASLLTEGVRGYRVVKAFGMEEFEAVRFGHATRRHLRANLWAQMLSHASGPVVESLAVLGAAALLIWAGQSIRAGSLTAPELIKFLTTMLMMYDPIRKLNKVNLILQEATAAGERVSRLLAIPNEVAERPGARTLDTVRDGVHYEGVSFGYERTPVLQNVELPIRAGEIVALVGHSGAGKSTLVNLLPRFFDPDEGRVTIDGIDIRDLKLRSLRALIGLVTQETVLFNDTVRNNIAYGRSDLPLERVREAAAAAYADEFIMEMERRLRHGDRRGRAAPLGRATAAAGDRPRAAQERADPDPRRGHLAARQPVRSAGAEGALQPDAGADDAGHRPPSVDGDAGRPHRGDGRRADRRGGLARRAAGARRAVQAAVRPAVQGVRSAAWGPRSSPSWPPPSSAGCAPRCGCAGTATRRSAGGRPTTSASSSPSGTATCCSCRTSTAGGGSRCWSRRAGTAS